MQLDLRRGQYGPFLACSRLGRSAPPAIRRGPELARGIVILRAGRIDGFRAMAAVVVEDEERSSVAPWRFH